MPVWVIGQPCWYCGLPAQSRDHQFPRYRPGTKIVPCCHWCNSLKGQNGPEGFRAILKSAWIGETKWANRVNFLTMLKRNFVFYGELNMLPFTVSGDTHRRRTTQ